MFTERQKGWIMPDRSTVLRYRNWILDIGPITPDFLSLILDPADQYQTTNLEFVEETLRCQSSRDIGAFYISFLPDTTKLEQMVISNMTQWFDTRCPDFSKCEKLFTTLRHRGISAEAFFTETHKLESIVQNPRTYHAVLEGKLPLDLADWMVLAMAEILIEDVYEGSRVPVDNTTITILEARIIETEAETADRSRRLDESLSLASPPAAAFASAAGVVASDDSRRCTGAAGPGGGINRHTASIQAPADIIAAERARIAVEKSGLCFP